MPDKQLDRLLGDHDAMKSKRVGHEASWHHITEILYPDGTSPFGIGTAGQATRGEIYDNTGEDAAETATAAFHAMTTNPATRWMELGVFDQQWARDTYGGAWLYEQTSRLFRNFRHPSTLFNLAMDEDNTQLIMLGNSCLHVEERSGKLPLYRACPMANIWWDENSDGMIDEVHREFELTAIAAVERPGWARQLPEEVLKMADAKGQAYNPVKFLHVNAPRRERDASKRDRSNMAFRSIYICLDFPAIIEDGGSHELEYVCSRWRRRAGEIYARGCGHKGLGDVEVLQRMNRVTLLAGERTIDPTILAPDDGITGAISLKARAIVSVRAEYLANGAAPRALNPNTRVDIGMELIQDRRELVRRSFLKQLIEIVRDPKFTATQFLSIEGEQKRGLAPILGRQQQERFGPLVERTFNILARMPGVLDPTPPELRDQPLQPNFDSEAAQAMRMGTARAIAQAFDSIGPIVTATGDTALWDNFDLDDNVRAIAEGVGMPARQIKPVEVRDRMRVQRQQIAEERAQLENAKDFTTSLKNAAPMVQALTGAAANQNGNAPAEAAA
ncbi:portal protein [Reyranella sp.]|uniref:portal protein n=1 Tax=Reyranella sp. TaxID=1929291 RepID=UPI003D09CCB0